MKIEYVSYKGLHQERPLEAIEKKGFLRKISSKIEKFY